MPIRWAVCGALPAAHGRVTSPWVYADVQLLANLFSTSDLLVKERIADKMEDGRPFTIGRRYGLSLHEKAALFKDLKSYAKKAPPQNLDLETLIGKPCTILVVHVERDGSTYANVQAVLPASAKKLTVDKAFVRKINRNGATTATELDHDGNPVPF